MGRRALNREFKLEAIELVRERGISAAQAGRYSGIHANVVSRLVREAQAEDHRSRDTRGASTRIGPSTVSTVLAVVPLR